MLRTFCSKNILEVGLNYSVPFDSRRSMIVAMFPAGSYMVKAPFELGWDMFLLNYFYPTQYIFCILPPYTKDAIKRGPYQGRN